MICKYCDAEMKRIGMILTGTDQWGAPTAEHEYRCPNCDAHAYADPYDPPYWTPGDTALGA
jgi:hypothetical protein